MPSISLSRKIEGFEGWVLASAGIYFLTCGISAVFWPELWYKAAGLPIVSNDLALEVTGGMMTAMGIGALLAAPHHPRNVPIIIMLFAGNFFDLCLIIHAVFVSGALPLFNGTMLALVDLTWCLLLGILLKRIRTL